MSNSSLTVKQLYDEFADPIYRFIYWHTSDPLIAEDLVGEVFFRAWKHNQQIRQGNQRAWLYRVARNLIIDYYRRRKDEVLDESNEIRSDYDLHQEAERNDTNDHLHRVLADLPLESRTIIVLRFFEHLSAKEVAGIMGRSEANIRVLQHRALKTLKQRLAL